MATHGSGKTREDVLAGVHLDEITREFRRLIERARRERLFGRLTIELGFRDGVPAGTFEVGYVERHKLQESETQPAGG